ncbi:MAG: hypothetical protein H7Y04_10880, partial [Verrucomicrobia bacterium]|nr:hypothetical protein [Cytophagales bacterium]
DLWVGMQRQRGQTRNPNVEVKKSDKLGLSLVLLSFSIVTFLLDKQKKSKKLSLFQKPF